MGEVPLPELAPDEAYVAVMASAINFNTVRPSIFELLSTFGFLDRLGRESVYGARHALDHHVIGSDASGRGAPVGAAAGPGAPATGSRSTAPRPRPGTMPTTHSMLAVNQRIWGFETNFGGPRGRGRGEGQPADAEAWRRVTLTRRRRPSTPCGNSTAYGLVVSRTRPPLTQGDVVLVWGRDPPPRSFAVQVRRAARSASCRRRARADTPRELGCELVLDGAERGRIGPGRTPTPRTSGSGRRLGADTRELAGRDPDTASSTQGARP